MTNVMMATYPEVFVKGAVMAGIHSNLQPLL